MREAVCDIDLESPYENSRQIMHALAIVKKIRIIQSFRNGMVMRVGVPVDLFIQWYKVRPEKGTYPPPKGADKFITAIRVRKLRDL